MIKKKTMIKKKNRGSVKGFWAIGISMALMLIINNVFGQGCRGVEVINNEGKEIVKQAEAINWYGLDLSMASLTNGKKSKDGELIRDTYCPAWITYFNDKIPPEKLEKRSYFGKKVIYDPVSVQDRYKLLDTETWVTHYEKNINEEQIKDLIKSYELQEKEGIGCVLIVDNLNKPKERTTAYLTFFDIKSREIYWLIKSKAKADGWGMTGFWGQGLMGNFKCAIKVTHY
jgi:hypothetical protein